MKPNYEPPEFHDNLELEEIIEEEKEKYGIGLERGKFYSKKHFDDFCGFVQRWRSGALLWAGGIYVGSLAGMVGLSFKLIPYPSDWTGGLYLTATVLCSNVGAIALSDNLLLLYRKICNKTYKKYCEDNDIPYNK